MGHLALLLTLALAGLRVRADTNVLKDITLDFGGVLKECREESQLTEAMMEEFFHFWREDFKFEHRELGCAIRCIFRHYNLFTDSQRLHHENADMFIKTFPNGEILSQHMIALIHGCEKQHTEKEDHCWRILHTAECFKKATQHHGIAPNMEMMIAEFIMEAEAGSP